MKLKHTAGAVLVVLALAATAACGSDDTTASTTDDSANGSPPATAAKPVLTTGGAWDTGGIEITTDELTCGTTSTDPTRGITDTSIKVGGLITKSGPTTALYGDTESGAKARFARANAEGGVNGRTIDFVGAEDDGMESSRQVDAARKLVDQKVFAVVPLQSAVPAFQETFCQAVMPHFGWGTSAAWCNDTVGFGITGCLPNPHPVYNSTAVGALITALEGTDQTIAMIGADAEAARLGMDKISEGLEHYGVKTVYFEPILSPNTPLADPSSIVNDIMTSNDGGPPAMVYGITDFPNTSTIVQALRAAGYDGIIVSAVGYDPRLAKFEGFDNTLTALQWAPFEATGIPFVDQMNEDFDEYAADTNRGLPAAAGYIAADMFLTAVKDTGRDLTVDSFLETLNGGWTYSTPDFRGDAVFPDNHVLGVPCGTLVLLEDQTYSLSVPVTCNPPFLR